MLTDEHIIKDVVVLGANGTTLAVTRPGSTLPKTLCQKNTNHRTIHMCQLSLCVISRCHPIVRTISEGCTSLPVANRYPFGAYETQ